MLEYPLFLLRNTDTIDSQRCSPFFVDEWKYYYWVIGLLGYWMRGLEDEVFSCLVVEKLNYESTNPRKLDF